MANIRFIFGPLGGGQMEISGEAASFLRYPGIVPPFVRPEKFEKNVYWGWISGFSTDTFNEIEEFKHLYATSTQPTFNDYLNNVNSILSNYPTATDFVFLVGAGSVYVHNFINQFPDATFYFTDRQQSSHCISLMTTHALEKDLCACGVNHNIDVNKAAFQTFVEQTNTKISLAMGSMLDVLGYQWTAGNVNIENNVNMSLYQIMPTTGGINQEEKRVHAEVIFMAPAKVAVYKRDGSAELVGFSKFHGMPNY